MNANIPGRALQIMLGNRDQYIKDSLNLVGNLEIPESVDDLLAFCTDFQTKLGHYAKTTLRSYAILSEFFKNEVHAVAGTIGKLNKGISQLMEVFTKSGLHQAKMIRSDITLIKHKEKHMAQLQTEEKEVQEALIQLTNEINSLQGDVKAIKHSVAFKQYLHLISSEQGLQQELKEAEKKVFHSFSVIESPLKKFERITLDQKLIVQYLQDPLKALESDHDLAILPNLQKLASALEHDQIEVKEKKKEKVLAELPNMQEILSSFNQQKTRIKNDLSRLQSQKENAMIFQDLQTKEIQLRKLLSDKRSQEDAAKEASKRKSSMSLEQLRNRIKERLEGLDSSIRLRQ